MHSSLFLTLCVLLLCGEYASSEPAAECLPEQWEAVAVGDLAQVVSPSGDVDIMSLRYWQSYDFKLRLDSTRQLIEIGNTTVRVTVINDWNKMKTYNIFHDLKGCKVEALTGPGMKRWCPGDPDLELVDTFTVGGEYADMYKMTTHNTNSTITLFSKTFQMITISTENAVPGRTQTISMQYGNFTSGIHDMSVFDIPEYCHSPPTTKCAPNMWQAVAHIKSGPGDNSATGKVTLSVDFRRRLEVYDGHFSTVSAGSKNQRVQIFKNFAQGKAWAYYPDTVTCIGVPVNQTQPEIPRVCSDQTSGHIRQEPLILGNRTAGIYYFGKDVGQRTIVTAYRDNMEYVSVFQTGYTHSLESWAMSTYLFGNFTTHIKDPDSVFELPKSCKP